MQVADKGTRFVNHFIDMICFFTVIMLHAFILDGLLHVIPEGGSNLLGIYFFVLYFGYHFVFEHYFGRTPGKFFTKTKVTDIHGAKPTAKFLVIRNICRLIPFDIFSFLFSKRGWHDSISRTHVVHA